MDACACAWELLGVFAYAAGWLCSLATTVLPRWLSMSTELLAIESYELGLWETCVVQDTGATECRAYDSLLGLSYDLKLARIMMCASLATGLLGILVTVPGLRLVNSCKDRGGSRAKGVMMLAGGALALLSGVLCLVPVSYVAHLTVQRFFDEAVPAVVPRWEFGDALFSGWAAGFLLLAAGLLLVTSRPCSRRQELQPARRPGHQVRGAELSCGKRSEYV